MGKITWNKWKLSQSEAIPTISPVPTFNSSLTFWSPESSGQKSWYICYSTLWGGFGYGDWKSPTSSGVQLFHFHFVASA
jgi:hypothetical protein